MPDTSTIESETVPQTPEDAAKDPTTAISWSEFLGAASARGIKDRYLSEVNSILTRSATSEKYCFLALLEPENSIDAVDLDGIFESLTEHNSERKKDVLLILLSRGGNIEPAYQISKLCKSFAANRFVVVVPREAKSAATLIALGADEIHMGQLGQLGPIDPQLGGLPALGVAQALKTLAGLAQVYPGSSDMFARYLQMAVTVEQIGYCDRISESALQYAERLLSTKPKLTSNANAIAKRLVYEYKHHGFVIDVAEARSLLGRDLIIDSSPEIELAEELYRHFDKLNFELGLRQKKRIIVAGNFSRPQILILKRKE
jgi:hypothetical protein